MKTTAKGSLGGSPAKPEKIARITQGGITTIIPLGAKVLAWLDGADGSGEDVRLVGMSPAAAVVEHEGQRRMVPWWFVGAPQDEEALLEAEIVHESGIHCTPSRRNETAAELNRRLTGDMEETLEALSAIREKLAAAIHAGGMTFRGKVEDGKADVLQKIAGHVDGAAAELLRLIAQSAYPFHGKPAAEAVAPERHA